MADTPPLVATYRLQLTPSFGLDAAAALVPYLARLGISHVYTSSYLQAAAGSAHGYDTTDHARVNVELGGEEALVRFHAAVRANGLGNVIDVVPNHMSVADAHANRRWWNVLRDGPTSPDARFFDIDWNPPEPKLAGRILLPVLGDDYATELAGGVIACVDVDGALEVQYGEMRFPVAEHTLSEAANIDSAADLHALLERQFYRLACWRVGRDEVNYRRFFDVTTLAGVRVEDPDVFAAVHERTLEWVRSGAVHGLRIDHPDGLRDPGGYFDDLRREAPDAWIVIEKILEPGEALPEEWPVDGTTGYDAMRRLTALFVDPAAEDPLTSTFCCFVDDDRTYPEHVAECKGLVLRDMFGAEVTRLVGFVADIAEAGVSARDFSRREIRVAIEALLIAMPVYRTYVTDRGGFVVSAQDETVIERTVTEARRLEPGIAGRLFDFLGGLLRNQLRGEAPHTSSSSLDVAEFVARFQQLSGPAMAKGLEDTLFYRYNRLVALNEVGSDPSLFGMSIDEFHADMAAAARDQPLSMSATSTHDTKRSEDVRARIALISEVPAEWDAAVRRWRSMNEGKWGSAIPNRTMEYLLYQTLFGASPLTTERTHQYLLKAMREAKQITSWLHPSAAEQTMFEFADAVAADPAFQDDLARFVERFDRPARIAGLSQLLLKTLGPGIPDFYQGSEHRTSTLVDPDNRSDIDYAERIRLLDASLDREVSLSKMQLMQRLLKVRRHVPGAFTGEAATYEALALDGARSSDAIAFRRGGNVIAITPVRPVAVARNGWGNTMITLPDGEWTDALDDSLTDAFGERDGDPTHAGRVAVSELTGASDLAVLIKNGPIKSGPIKSAQQQENETR